jgi:hypothetical protein
MTNEELHDQEPRSSTEIESDIRQTRGRMHATRTKFVKTLHDQLGQHLAETLFAAGALSARLTRRHAPEAGEAACLLEMLMNANKELNGLITHLDTGKPR